MHPRDVFVRKDAFGCNIAHHDARWRYIAMLGTWMSHTAWFASLFLGLHTGHRRFGDFFKGHPRWVFWNGIFWLLIWRILILFVLQWLVFFFGLFFFCRPWCSCESCKSSKVFFFVHFILNQKQADVLCCTSFFIFLSRLFSWCSWTWG
jgi:hypothetical protein